MIDTERIGLPIHTIKSMKIQLEFSYYEKTIKNIGLLILRNTT